MLRGSEEDYTNVGLHGGEAWCDARAPNVTHPLVKRGLEAYCVFLAKTLMSGHDFKLVCHLVSA